MSLSLTVLEACFAHTVGRVRYRLGAKPALGADSAAFDESDCSGWVRWALDRAGLLLPDGSATQHAWCASHLREEKYRSAGPLADTSRLFIAFITPGSGIGHVWLLRAGSTRECSGHRGVNSRAWDTPVLLNNVTACYELPALEERPNVPVPPSSRSNTAGIGGVSAK